MQIAQLKLGRDGAAHTANVWTECGQHIQGKGDTPFAALLTAAALGRAAETTAKPKEYL